MSKPFNELKFRAWDQFMNSVKPTERVTFDWKKRPLPVGVPTLEHYEGGCSKLMDIITKNVPSENLPATTLIIGPTFLPVMAISSDFTHNPPESLWGPYEAGLFRDIPVVVDPSLPEDKKLVFDLQANKVIEVVG